MSKPDDEQTVRQEPWSGVQQPLRNLYSTTQNALANTLPYYPGQTYPNLTPLQEAGMFGNLDYAQNFYAPAATGLQQQLGRYMDAPLNISQDPAVLNMLTANTNSVQDWLTTKALPMVRHGAVANDMYGASRQGIAEGQAIGDAAQALANANSQTTLGAYDTASGLARQGATMFPTALEMGFRPGDMAQQYGGAYQGLAGQQIQELMNRYAYPEQSLWDKLASAGGIYSGAGNYGTSTTDMPGASPLAGALGGGLAGVGAAQFLSSPAGAGIFGGTPTIAGLGSAGTLGLWGLGGALLGGLLS